MTFSYSPTLARALDRVRFLLGDTVDAGHLVENQEITYVLAAQPIETFAAAAIAESLAGRFAAQADVSIGATSISNGDRAARFRELAVSLRRAGGSIGGGDGTGVPTVASMYVGGASIDARTTLQTDTSIIQPAFRIGQDDHPGTEQVAGVDGE